MTPPLPDKRYDVILADPPWPYDDTRNHKSVGAVLSAYNTMSIEAICALPVQNIAKPDCALVMWATWPKLKEAMQVIDAWGFKYLTCAFVWVKLNPTCGTRPLNVGRYDLYSGMGHYTQSGTEFALLARRGKPLARNAGDVRQVVMAPVGEHSAKPAVFRQEVVRLFGTHTERVELYARDRGAGFDVWGLEAPGQDGGQSAGSGGSTDAEGPSSTG